MHPHRVARLHIHRKGRGKAPTVCVQRNRLEGTLCDLDPPPIRTDELLTAPSALHESAVAFGLLAEPFPGDVPLEHLDGPHHDSPADRLHDALKRGQPPDNLDDQL
jgi:hypothetical protein